MWKIIRYYRQLCIWLKVKRCREHPAYKFSRSLTAEEFYLAVIPLGYVQSSFPYCYTYPGQIFSVRRLVRTEQYHLRFWSDNTFTGHYEHNFEFDLASHMRGEGVIGIDSKEQQRIVKAVYKFKRWKLEPADHDQRRKQ